MFQGDKSVENHKSCEEGECWIVTMDINLLKTFKLLFGSRKTPQSDYISAIYQLSYLNSTQ